MKPLLSIDEQIEHMKDKGISFKIVSEDSAKDFLRYNNYYMKLAAYRTNYEKHISGKKAGQYIALDFGYLKELSTIDMHLRYLIIEMCLDIEHAMKVKLLNEITNNPAEDGYEIIRKFLAKDNRFRVLNNIKSHQTGEYCKDLIKKYYPFFPAWVFVELISFGDLIHLCAFYEETYGVQIVNGKLMNEVRDIRNACAHSNCLMNKMMEKIDKTKQPNSEITNFIKAIPGISDGSRKKYLNTKFSYNLVTLFYVYNKVVHEIPKKKRVEQLKSFMDDRVVRNKSYFTSNQRIVGLYNFHKKVIDNM